MSQSQVSTVVYRDTNRISIIDPNNPANDISGGARNTATVFGCFSKALVALRERMNEVAAMPTNKQQEANILECLLGGDYTQFREQRIYMSAVHKAFFGVPGDASLHKEGPGHSDNRNAHRESYW